MRAQLPHPERGLHRGPTLAPPHLAPGAEILQGWGDKEQEWVPASSLKQVQP